MVESYDTMHYRLPISLNRWEGDDYLLIEHLLGIKENEGIMETDYGLLCEGMAD